MADAPGLGASRWDGTHCFTTIPGPHAALLLRCYESTGEVYFRNIALAYLRAYDQYGYDAGAGTFHAMLELDGTPVPGEPKGAGYDAYKPTGYVDMWGTVWSAYEFPLHAAQTYMLGYELTDEGSGGDPDLLAAALRWAGVIERNLPTAVGRRWKDELEAALPLVIKTGGTYAENYGRTISFFVHLYHATGNQHYLQVAELVGREAVRKLYVNGMFKAHPAKPYYETADGVGLLLMALLELDAVPERLFGAF